MLFTSILRHGFLPTSLRECILVPIPKGRKDHSKSDNYRGIALPPTLSKLLEWSLLTMFPSKFSTSELQFGFKKGVSTNHCTGLIKAVVSRYLNSKSNVFACFLDASKAFDRVNHSVLFSRLLDCGLPPSIVRLLLGWYSDQKLQVRWNGLSSDPFSVSNGVRQGGVLSPILFTVDRDDLLLRLKECDIGCHWSSFYSGAVCYAENLVVLVPSLSVLRFLLSNCESFAIDRGLSLNPAKTQLIQFGRSQSSICSGTVWFVAQDCPFLTLHVTWEISLAMTLVTPPTSCIRPET